MHSRAAPQLSAVNRLLYMQNILIYVIITIKTIQTWMTFAAGDVRRVLKPDTRFWKVRL